MLKFQHFEHTNVVKKYKMGKMYFKDYNSDIFAGNKRQ